MSLRAKLLLAQAPLVACLILVGAFSRSTIGALGTNSQNILKDNYLSVLCAQRMQEAADALDREALFAAAGEKAPPSERTARAERARFEHDLSVQESNITEPGEREATERLRAGWTAFLRALDSGGDRAHYFAETEPGYRALKAATAEILNINQDAMVRKSEHARKAAASRNAIMLAITIGACLLGWIASTILTSRLVRPLSALGQTARRIGEGDLEARAAATGGDEIADLARELNTMAERLARYRKSSLGELLQAQRASQATIDSLPDPVIVLDRAGTVLNANHSAETLFGVLLEPGTREPLDKAPPGVRATIDHLRDHVLSGKGAYVPKGFEEATLLSTDEGPKYLLARATPVYGEQGEITAAAVLFQDVTRLRRFDELKNDLVATVAHEFRTPLTSLRMAIHLCIEESAGPITEKQKDLLYAAREDCERLQGIVDDLLDLSRIQAGRIDLHQRAVSPSSLIESAIDEHRHTAEEREIDLNTDPENTDRPVLADPDRVHLVLTNLLSNALRHTPAGGHIEVRTTANDERVRFEVRDSGEGVPREFHERIFERFFRAPGAQPGGAGLGLYISREIVREHEGEMGVESEPGRGSTFWFTLPAAPALQT